MSEKRQLAIKQAGLKSRKAMVWLRDHKMPADPICYTIAYEYLHSESPKLNQRIDSLNIEDDDYLSKIKKIYQDCIISEEFKELSMSGDVGNQYVSEVLSLLLDSADMIKDNTAILESVELEISNNQNKAPEHEIVLTKQDYSSIAENASRDALTSALDFDGLKQSVVAAIQDPENFPISILRINLDLFRQFNDTNGKFMGDAVLKNLVKTLQNNLKGNDLTSRYDSDEFIVALPKTDVRDAVKVADNLRLKLASLTLKKKNSSIALKFTVSIGVAEMTKSEAFESVLEKCKKALLRSKDLGRNCVNQEN